MKKTITIITAILVLASLVPVVQGSFAATTTPEYCADGSTMSWAEIIWARDHGAFTVNPNFGGNGVASAEVINNTDCIAPVSLAAYKMFNQNIYEQELFDTTNVVSIPPKTTQNLSINLPGCMAQVDFFHGQNEPYFTPSKPQVNVLLAGLYLNEGPGGLYGGSLETAAGPFCSNGTTTPATPALTITKSATANVSKGGTVTFGIVVTNTGSTTANNIAVTDAVDNDLAYSTSSAACHISSGNDLICSKSSLAAGESVTFTAVYTVADNSSVCGTTIKNIAKVTADSVAGVSSNETSTTVASCGGSGSSLSVTCVATPASIVTIGTPIVWSSTVTGASGTTTYAWSGTDSLTGSNATTSITYTTTGLKSATILVNSGSLSASSTCEATISPRGGGGGGGGGTPSTTATPTTTASVVSSSTIPNQVAGIYLTQVPYTGFKENAIAAVVALAVIAGLGYVAVAYSKKRSEYAYEAAALAPKIAEAKAHESFVSSVESYARSKQSSVSADAVEAIVSAARGDIEYVKSVIDRAVESAGQSDWTLITLETLRKAYPHI